MKLTEEQEKVLKSNVKDLVVSASAGSGKTFVVIEKLIGLICDKKVPVERLLVLTFTKAASNEMKNRLYNAILEKPSSKFLLEQIDMLPLSDISTIDSFCEKIIKRNINKLDIDENFAILDEKTSKNLKKLAFSRTFQYFSQNESEIFEQIYFAFKRNKNTIEECVFSIQDYLSSINDQETLLQHFENNIDKYDALAQESLKNKIKISFKNTKNILLSMGQSNFTKVAENIFNKLTIITNQDFDKDLFTLSQNICSNLPMPDFRGTIDADDKKFLMLARDYIREGLSIAENFSYQTKDFSTSIKEGVLIKSIAKFYKHYINLYNGLKNKRDGLDFADIEFYAKKLLQDDEIKRDLQSKYDYIFIDEYQDTNRLQQSILNPIAQGGFFVAVGDLKQGIYGFRNARMEIMKEDIENFQTKENGDALYLTGNFRTDKSILEFVNLVFEKIMTIESVGIDYSETSKLQGLRHYEDDNMPAVAIDIVEKMKKEKKEEKEFVPQIYSVKEDSLENENKYKDELLAIQNRIEQSLQNQIYDAKLEKYRDVNFNDITLLFRNRSGLMNEAYKFLSQKGFPVNADLKSELLEDGEIAVIYSLLKLTLNQKDDIPLVSVMSSIFGGFSLEELADLRLGSDKDNKQNFYEIIENNENKKITAFKEMVENFRFDIQVFGIIKSLNRLFNKFDYFNYLKSLPNGNEKISNINSLFKIIRSANLDNKVSSVISQLEGVTENTSSGGGNSISLTTIHATKGLEYPIVILCDAGESLIKPYTKSFVLSEKFGFASYINDFDNMIRIPSPSFVAGKLEKKEKEFIDEIMIFYVALTRAQNHLYIIGSASESDFTFENLKHQNSYLKMIFFALGENLSSQIFTQQHLIKGRWEFNVFDEFEDKPFSVETVQPAKNKFKKEIEEYNNFNYPYKDISKLSFKNSVTGAMKLNEQEEILSFKAEEKENVNSQIAIERGNAYHEALKLLNFENINSIEDLNREIEKTKDSFTEGYIEYIDKNILLKNILTIKQLTKNSTLYKEKEFIMQCSLEELGLSNQHQNENVIVQGIVDLFAVGEEIVLIDYKFSSLSGDRLKDRYAQQIHLYTKALEKCFGKKIEKRFLLSLKDAQIISL